MRKVASETGEAAIGKFPAVEAAMAAEATETSTTEVSSAVVVATAVVATVAAAAVTAVEAGSFLFPLPRWRFPQTHPTSTLEYPRLLDVAAAPEAAVLRSAELYS